MVAQQHLVRACGRDVVPQNVARGYDTTFLAVSGCVSILASSYVLYQYKRHRALRRHPATLIIQRSVADLVFCLFCVSAAIPGAHDLMNESACGFSAFVMQTAALEKLAHNKDSTAE